MGTVKRLAEEVERGLRETDPELRKTVVSKLSLGKCQNWVLKLRPMSHPQRVPAPVSLRNEN